MRNLAHRVGRRGFSLLFLAMLDVLYADSLWLLPPELKANRIYSYLATVLPVRVWAAIWLVVGLLCLVQAFLRSDRIAFTAAVMLKLSWGTLFGIGWMFYGVERGWVSAVVWVAFGAWVFVVSSWPEEERSTVEMDRR